MKIGLFTDTFYPEINGVATSCLTLERALTRRGHEVHVFAPKCRGWEENQREHIHYIPSAPFIALRDRNFAFPSPITTWEAEKLDFDVVHTNSEFVMGHFGHHIAKSIGCAVVHTYHTVWEDYNYYIPHGVADEAARKITRKYSQWWCNRFDRVITPTEKTLDLLRRYGVQAVSYTHLRHNERDLVFKQVYARAFGHQVKPLGVDGGIGRDVHLVHLFLAGRNEQIAFRAFLDLRFQRSGGVKIIGEGDTRMGGLVHVLDLGHGFGHGGSRKNDQLHLILRAGSACQRNCAHGQQHSHQQGHPFFCVHGNTLLFPVFQGMYLLKAWIYTP